MSTLMQWLPLIEQIAEIVLPLVAALAAWAIRRWLLAKAKTEHRAMLLGAAEAAYWVVAQIARKTPHKLDDKVAEALRVVSAELRRPLEDDEKATVVNALKAYHEQARGVGAGAEKPA